MRKLSIIFLILLFAISVNAATTVSGRPCPGGATASCTTPTGDELTESFGDASSSCWSGGVTTCNNTWAKTAGTLAIAASPASAPANTACTNSLYVDSSGGAAHITYAFPGTDTIPNNVEVTFNFSLYVDTAPDMAQYGTSKILTYSATTTITDANRYFGFGLYKSTAGTGTPNKMQAGGNASSCELDFLQDTWYDVTITLDAAAAASGSTFAIGDGTTHCHFTRDTDASRYLNVGASLAGYHHYIGNIRITTP